MDNASTDSTAKIAQAYASRDGRIRYYCSEQFLSAVANWSRAFEKIDRTRAKFFMWASDDDVWAPGFIEQLLRSLINDRKCVLAFANCRDLDLAGQIVGRKQYGEADWQSSSTLGAIRWLIENGLGVCAIYGIMRMDALNWSPLLVECPDGRFVAESAFPGDFWFVLQLAIRGRLSYCGEVLFWKRIGGWSTPQEGEPVRAPPIVIGEREWRLIDGLPIPYYVKWYFYCRLKVLEKLQDPSKKIAIYLWPWFAVEVLKVNKRGLGLTTRMIKFGKRLLARGSSHLMSFWRLG